MSSKIILLIARLTIHDAFTINKIKSIYAYNFILSCEFSWQSLVCTLSPFLAPQVAESRFDW